MWTSCPHACITPLFREAYSKPVFSSIGSASMSARSTTQRRRSPRPSIRARTPGSGYRPEFDARLPQAIDHITGSLPLLERQLGIGMQSPSGKQHLPGNSLRRLFDRIIGFHTATIKIAFAGPTAGSATPKHQSTHPLSTGNRGARTFSSVGRPSAPTRFPTARRLVGCFRTVSSPTPSDRFRSSRPSPEIPHRFRQGRFPASHGVPGTVCIQHFPLYERHAPANAPNTPSGNRTDRINTPFSNLSRFGLRPRSAPLTLPAAERTVSVLIYGRVDMPKRLHPK